MNINNNDGLSRIQRMKQINRYGNVVLQFKKETNILSDKIDENTSREIRDNTAQTNLNQLVSDNDSIVTNNLAQIVNGTTTENTQNVSQVTSTQTLNSNAERVIFGNEVVADRTAILDNVQLQIDALTAVGTPPTVAEEANMRKTALGYPNAPSVGDAETLYYNDNYKLKLGYPNAADVGTAEGLYLDKRIAEGLGTSNYISFMGNFVDTIESIATATLVADSVNVIDIIDGGSNYTKSPDVIITGGGGGTGTNAKVNMKWKIVNYILTNKGDNYSSPPTITFGGGGATRPAKANAILGQGEVTNIDIVDGGAGYTSNPSIILINGGELVAADVTPVLTNGSITSVIIVNGGERYSIDPSVVITGGRSLFIPAELVVNISGGKINSIVINKSGYGYISEPTINFSHGNASASIVLDPVDGSIIFVIINDKGSGYTQVPTIELIGGVRVVRDALLIASIGSQTIKRIEITDGGEGYILPPSMTIDGLAQATPILGNGSIISVDVLNGGSGYTSAPDVSFINGGREAVAKPTISTFVNTIDVTNPGTFYQLPPDVVITGDGSGAKANANLTNDFISSITVTESGSGYTYPPIISFVNKENDTGRYATAVSVLGTVGSVNSIDILSGKNYIHAPLAIMPSGTGAITKTNIENGYITSVGIIDGGKNYTNGSEITFVGGGGQNAFGVLVTESQDKFEIIDSTGKIKKYKVYGVIKRINLLYKQSTYNTIPAINIISSNSIATGALATVDLSTQFSVVDLKQEGNNYDFTSIISDTNAIDAYNDYRIKLALGLPYVQNETLARDNYYENNMIVALGFDPDIITPSYALSIIPREFMENVDSATFPNTTNLEAANLLWYYNNMQYTIAYPETILMPEIDQDNLYKTAFGYPGATSVDDARNKYKASTMKSLLSGVNVEKPISHPEKRADMDIVDQVGVRQKPIIIKKENQYKEFNKKSQTTTISFNDGFTRLERLDITKPISEVLLRNSDLIRNNIIEIYDKVSIDYRESTINSEFDFLKNQFNNVSTFITDGFVSSKMVLYVAEYTALHTATAIALAAKATDEKSRVDNILTPFYTDPIIDSVNNNINKIALRDVDYYRPELDSLESLTENDISYIFDICQASINLLGKQNPPSQSEKDQIAIDAFNHSLFLFVNNAQKYINIPNPNPNINLLLKIPITGIEFIKGKYYYNFLNQEPISMDLSTADAYRLYRYNLALGTSESSIANAENVYVTNAIKRDMGYPNALDILTAASLSKDKNSREALGFPNACNLAAAVVAFSNNLLTKNLGYPKQVTNIKITNRGSGYTGVPNVYIYDGESETATAKATIVGGAINSISIIENGHYFGYPPFIQINGDGNGAIATVSLNNDELVTTVTVSNGGQGYTYATVKILSNKPTENAEASAVVGNGKVENIIIENKGNNYMRIPKVKIVGGGGTGATAEVTNVIIPDYVIVSVYSTLQAYIDNGYSNANLNTTFAQAQDYYVTQKLLLDLSVNSDYTVDEGKVIYKDRRYQEFWIDNIGPPIFLSVEQFKAVFGSNEPLNSSTNLEAETYWTRARMAYYNRDFIPSGINPAGLSNDDIDQLYKTEFGYSATDTIVNGGNNYSFAPTVVFEGGEGQDAVVEPILYNQEVINYNILAPGSGYASTPTIIITGGNPSVQASVDAVITNGILTGFTNIISGSGYQDLPIVTIQRNNTFTPAEATAEIINGIVSSVIITNPGSGYGFPPIISFIDDPTGGGANVTSRVKDDATLEIIITVEDAENGYFYKQMDEYFNKQEIRNNLSIVSNKGETSMNIGTINLTHEERVYGRKTKDTETQQSSMTLSMDTDIFRIKERLPVSNMSISQRPTSITRNQRIASSKSYYTLYRQARAIVKSQIIRDANKVLPQHYTAEQQKQLLLDQLAKLTGKKRNNNTAIIENPNKGKSFTIYNEKPIKVSYSKQLSSVNTMINDLINRIEHNRGTKAVATITNNNGTGYYLPTAIIDAPTASGTNTVIGDIAIIGGEITEIAIVTKGSGYLDVPKVTINSIIGSGATAIAITEVDNSNPGTLKVIDIYISEKGQNYEYPLTVSIEPVAVQATATIYTKNTAIDYVVIDNPGLGYESIPNITIGPMSQAGTGATLTPTIVNRRVDSIFVNNIINHNINVTTGGKGYDNIPPIVVITGGGGIGASATAVLTGDTVSSITLNNAGTGYVTAPKISFTITAEERYELIEKYWYGIVRANWTKSIMEDGKSFGEIKRIRQIKHVSNNSELALKTTNARADAILGYNILNDTVNSPPIQATASIVLASDSSIQSIVVNNPGSGYILPPLIDFSGNGIGATAISKVNNKGNLTEIIVTNGGTAYNNLSTVTIPYPDTLSEFKVQIGIANKLTDELRKSTGIDLEPTLNGVDALNSDILKRRSSRF